MIDDDDAPRTRVNVCVRVIIICAHVILFKTAFVAMRLIDTVYTRSSSVVIIISVDLQLSMAKTMYGAYSVRLVFSR